MISVSKRGTAWSLLSWVNKMRERTVKCAISREPLVLNENYKMQFCQNLLIEHALFQIIYYLQTYSKCFELRELFTYYNYAGLKYLTCLSC